MEKKLTAMQELINMIETFIVVNDDITDYYDGLEKARDLAQSLLPKEREQIEDAYVHGYTDGFNTAKHDDYFDFTDGSDYFTQTYQPTE